MTTSSDDTSSDVTTQDEGEEAAEYDTGSTERRSLDTLLALASYSLMSDEEVERVIAFKTKMAAMEADTKARTEQLTTYMEQQQAAAKVANEAAQAAFAAACAVRAQFATVQLADTGAHDG